MLPISPTILATQVKIPIPKEEFAALSNSKLIDNRGCFNSNIVKFGYELIQQQEAGTSGYYFLETCEKVIAAIVRCQCYESSDRESIQLPEAEIVDLSKTVTDLGYSRDIVEPIVECAYDFLKSQDERTAQSFLLKCDYSVAKRVLRSKYIRNGNHFDEVDNFICRSLMKHKLIEYVTAIANKSLLTIDPKTRTNALEDFETILEVIGLGILKDNSDFGVIKNLKDSQDRLQIGDRINFGKYLAA